MSSTAPSVDGDTRAICARYHDHCNFFWSLRIFSKPFVVCFDEDVFRGNLDQLPDEFRRNVCTYIGVLNSWYERSEGDSIVQNRTKLRNNEITLFYWLSIPICL